MSLKHAVAIFLLGVLILHIPLIFLWYAGLIDGNFTSFFVPYIIVVYPIIMKFTDMSIEALKGADD